MVQRGDETAIGVESATGQIARSPFSGSRMMPETKLDAAAFGRPGRTVTVIRRRLRPRSIPRRVQSESSCSHMNFCVP